jgi:hypothetical protein
MGTRQMIVGSDGQNTVIAEERPARPEHPSAERTPAPSEPAGQMFMIRRGVETLLEKGEPLHVLKPTQAWRRITGHLSRTGIHAREIPHRSTYNRFRKRYGSRYGLR